MKSKLVKAKTPSKSKSISKISNSSKPSGISQNTQVIENSLSLTLKNPQISFSAKKEPDQSNQTKTVFNPNLTNSFISPSKIIKSPMKNPDSYFDELQNFMDDTLKILAEKMAHKKSLEMECSANRLKISALKDDIKQLDTVNRKLKGNLEEETNGCLKMERENVEVTELLKTLELRSVDKSKEIELKINQLEINCENIEKENAEFKSQLENLKKEMSARREELKQDIREIELVHMETNAKIDEADQQISQAKIADADRLRMLSTKSRLLLAFNEKEETPMQTNILKKDISKMIKGSNSRARSSGRPSKQISKLSVYKV